MKSAQKVRLLRYQNPDGSSKDWAIPVPVPADRLPVWYGRTGTVLRCAQTPQGRCRAGSPHREAADRLAAKVRKGYHELGEFWLEGDGQTLRPVQPLPTPLGLSPERQVRAAVETDALLATLRAGGPGRYF